jgi:intracellular sulfur oxidation DsrE/DsrF family protein
MMVFEGRIRQNEGTMSMITARTSERRSFLSRLAASAAAFGGIALSGRAAHAQSSAASGWKPTRHTQDDWLDQIPGAHRFVLDTISPSGFGSALLYTNNFFLANQNGYGLGNSDNAVVIVARHNSTPFAYNDAMWKKYGMAIGDAAGGFDDPKTKTRPSANVYNSQTHGSALPNNGVTLDALIARGVHVAVCDMATHRFAGAIAAATKNNADEIYKELASNLIRNAHLVPAGIVAVNRAQERGYAFANAG